MGRIKCGGGEDGEPVGAHQAGPDGRRRAGERCWRAEIGHGEARRLPCSLPMLQKKQSGPEYPRFSTAAFDLLATRL